KMNIYLNKFSETETFGFTNGLFSTDKDLNAMVTSNYMDVFVADVNNDDRDEVLIHERSIDNTTNIINNTVKAYTIPFDPGATSIASQLTPQLDIYSTYSISTPTSYQQGTTLNINNS